MLDECVVSIMSLGSKIKGMDYRSGVTGVSD